MAFKGGGKALGVAGKFQEEDRSRDWYCNKCGERNFMKRSECYKCAASKPKDGEGKAPPPAPVSGTVLKGMIKSYNRKGFGFIMGLDGSPQSQDIYYSRESLHPSLQSRDIPGEHVTFEIHRFSDGKFLAKNIRPVGDAADIFTNGKGSDRQAPPPIRSEFKGKGKGGRADEEDRSRDWKCEQCGERNFEKRFECFQCKAPRKGRHAAEQTPAARRRISPHAGSRAFAQTLAGRAPGSRSRSRAGRRRPRRQSSSSQSSRKRTKKGKSSSSSSSSSSKSSVKDAGDSGAPAADADADAGGSKTENSEAEKAKSESLAKLMELRKIEPPQARLKQYRELLRRWHPDKNPENVEVATVVFQFLQKARPMLEAK